MLNLSSHIGHVFLVLQVARWSSHIGVPSCLKWAPRRVMLVAASSVLTFWIPNHGKITGESNANDADVATKLEVLPH